jgi:hypothetical protein
VRRSSLLSRCLLDGEAYDSITVASSCDAPNLRRECYRVGGARIDSDPELGLNLDCAKALPKCPPHGQQWSSEAGPSYWRHRSCLLLRPLSSVAEEGPHGPPTAHPSKMHSSGAQQLRACEAPDAPRPSH